MKSCKQVLIFIVAAIMTALAASSIVFFKPRAEVAAADGKSADIYLIAGQSNAAGSTRVDANDYGYEMPYTPTENVLYYGGTHKTHVGGTGRYLTDLRPVQHGCGYSDNHVGFEIGMAKVLNELPEYADGGRKAIIFKSASGSTSVFPESDPSYYGNWYPPSLWEYDYNDGDYFNLTGFQYRVFMSVFEELLVKLKAEGYTEITVKGLFWMQGESDRGRPEEYVEICKALFEDFRADISEKTGDDYSRLPVYVGEISKTFGSAAESSIEQNLNLIAAQHKIASSMPAVYVAPLKDYLINDYVDGNYVVLGSDSAHWNYNDIMSIGEDFMELFTATYGKNDGYIALNVTGAEIASKECTVLFDSTDGPNFSVGADKITFRVRTQTKYTVTDISADGAELALAGKEFEEGALAPTYIYELASPAADTVLNIEFGSNRSYRVTSSTPDKTYGSAPSPKVIENAYADCKYAFKTYPTSAGAVYKLIINGQEVYGEKNVIEYVFDDWEEKYISDDNKTLHIEVIYGEKSEVDALLDEYYGQGEQNPGDGSETGSDTDGGPDCGNCASAAVPSETVFFAAVMAGAALLVLKRRR